MSSRTISEKTPNMARFACMALLVVTALATTAVAQSNALATESAGFDTVGFIQAATIDRAIGTSGDLLSGGTIKVNDQVIIVPANSIVQMPAATLSWGQVFALAPSGVSNAGTATGLALADCAPPVGTGVGCMPGTWEAHVQGNIVLSPACSLHNDPTTGFPLPSPCYIAGLIFLSQQSLNSTSGFISAIDYGNGILIVNGRSVMINDPPIPGLTNPAVPGRNVGRFSMGQSPDVRFTADQGNPTVRSVTGYPMCIPRVAPGSAPSHPIVAGSTVMSTEDDRCPQRNRPFDTSGSFAMTFTMPQARSNPLTTPPSGVSDPWEQMPFEVGDFVTYAGVLMPPCAAGTGPGTGAACVLDLSAPQSSYIIAAYQVIDNVGVYTWPNSNPAYMAIDVLLQGTGGVPNPNFPQEATSKVIVDGMVTDPSRPVDIFALDQDCNGTLTDRLSAPWILSQLIDQGPPIGAKKGRFKFRPAGGAFLPPASVVRIRLSGYSGYLSPSTTDPNGIPLATPTIAANGLVYGQYNAPDFAFVFPEGLIVGGPIVTYNFGDFPWLVNGTGPLAGNPNYMGGQLSPWPDLTAPSPTCTPGVAPKLNANFTVTPDGISSPATVGNPVTLDAGAARESGATNFVWTLKPNIALQCVTFDCSVATFIPSSAGNITIQLTVTQVVNGAVIGTATSSFTLKATNKATDVVTITAATYRTSKARLDVNATSSIVLASPAGCTTTNVLPGCMLATLDIIDVTTGQPYTALMTNGGAGTYTVTFTGIAPPNIVTVTSGNGGSATSAVTRVK
ncbi:MAG TPA: hypothetical protein VF532_18655 [Candidatus Angelobacter sp.]